MLARPGRLLNPGSAGGQRLALDLRFLEGQFDSRLTFSRASSATRFNASGQLETVSSNVARLDHDPVTLAPRGLLIEEARTNLLLQSAAPATQDVTVTAAAHTISFYGSGTVTLSGAHSATLNGAGAFPARASLTFTPSAGTLTVTVLGTVEYANLTTGSFVTSWIPTTSATATRAADVCTLATSAFPFNASEGTLAVEFSKFTAAARGTAAMFGGATTGATTIAIDGQNNGQIRAFIEDNGTARFAALTLGSYTANTVHRAAMAWRVNDAAAVANGGTVSTGTPSAVPAVQELGVGVLRTGNPLASAVWLNGHIRRIRYWPRRLSNTELQQVTA